MWHLCPHVGEGEIIPNGFSRRSWRGARVLLLRLGPLKCRMVWSDDGLHDIWEWHYMTERQQRALMLGYTVQDFRNALTSRTN